MRILLFNTTKFVLMIELLYLSFVGLSNIIAKYDYCDDTAMAVKYDLHKPDFTEYGLKSKPECKQ